MAPPTKRITRTRRVLTLPGHPLAGKRGFVLESRAVLYATLGGGPHACHWCGRTVTWTVRHGRGTDRAAIVADHVDNDWRNNAPTNLVPSCQRCNGTRFKVVADAERQCQQCREPFLIPPAGIKRGRGHFCSRTCARLHQAASMR